MRKPSAERSVPAEAWRKSGRCLPGGIAFTARLAFPAQNAAMDGRALCVVFTYPPENGRESGKIPGKIRPPALPLPGVPQQAALRLDAAGRPDLIRSPAGLRKGRLLYRTKNSNE